MRLSHCAREAEIIAAAQSNQWTAAMREHAAACRVCTEVLLVENELRRASMLARDQVQLPAADLIWLRSRFEAQQSVLRPLSIAESWAFRCVLASAAVVAFVLANAVL
jgi:hypothetical protein